MEAERIEIGKIRRRELDSDQVQMTVVLWSRKIYADGLEAAAGQHQRLSRLLWAACIAGVLEYSEGGRIS